MRLKLCLASLLAFGIPVLVLTSWLLIPGPYANGLEGRFQNGTCQNQLFMWLNKLPKMAAARVRSSFLLHLQDTLQDQQVGLTQAPFKLLPLPCTTFKSGISIFHSLLGLLKVSLTGLHSGLISLLWTPRQVVQSEAQTHCYLWKVSAVAWLCTRSQDHVVWSWLYHNSASLICLIMIPSLYLSL